MVAIEPLEQRIAPASLVVSNISDSGPGSLRQAILDANQTPEMDDVSFQFAYGTVHRITLQTALPRILGSLIIDAGDQITDGRLSVELDGSSVQEVANGLDFYADRDAVGSIRGLSIFGFKGNGISSEGISIHLDTCFVGVDATGATVIGNAGDGLHFVGAQTEPVFASSSSMMHCVISGNGGDGIDLLLGEANHFEIQNSKIGTDVTGTLDLGNAGDGLRIDGARFSPAAVRDSIISGNDGYGIHMLGASFVMNSSFVGVDATGVKAVGNTLGGLLITGSARECAINGSLTWDGQQTVISGNGGHGIELRGAALEYAEFRELYVGVSKDGKTAVPNRGDGLLIDGIGEMDRWLEAGLSVFSGNEQHGIEVINSTKGSLYRSWIGVDKSGEIPVPNGGDGIYIHGATTRYDIGHHNQIAYNAGAGIKIVGGSSNVVHDLAIFGNGDAGIHLVGADQTAIDRTSIGVSLSGALIGNTGPGILLEQSTRTAIGSDGPPRSNIIAGNHVAGIMIKGGSGNTFQNLEVYENEGTSLQISKDKKTATWVDVDGDLVTLKVNRPVLDMEDFVLAADGGLLGERLVWLNLNTEGEAAKGGALNFSINAQPRKIASGLSGNSRADVGVIDADGRAFGRVYIDGDVTGLFAASLRSFNAFSVGKMESADPTAAGLGEIRVAERIGSFTIADDVVRTRISAKDLGSMNIRGDFDESSLDVEYHLASFRADNVEGGIINSGVIGAIHLRGSLVGGEESGTGAVSATSIGSVRIDGDFLGGEGGGSGIRSSSRIGPVRIAGDIAGYDVTHPVVIHGVGAFGRSPYGVASISVKGDAKNTWFLAGSPNQAGESLGPINVRGNWESSIAAASIDPGVDNLFGTPDDRLGGTSERDSVVRSIARIARITIGGTIRGTETAGDSFGFFAQRVGPLKIHGVLASKGTLEGTDDVRLTEILARQS